MKSEKVTLVNELGLHMRPASEMAQMASGMDCDVKINYNDKEYDAKSVMMLMSACLKKGYEVEVKADGPDEEKAVSQIVEFIASGLGD